MNMTASELAQMVIEATSNKTADDALAEKVATEFEALPTNDAYSFVVQVAHGLSDTEEKKAGLRAFNQKLAQHPKFTAAMQKISEAKAAGTLAKPT